MMHRYWMVQAALKVTVIPVPDLRGDAPALKVRDQPIILVRADLTADEHEEIVDHLLAEHHQSLR